MVAVNLQTSFLSPPVAMSAFYLKAVAPTHVTLNQIFDGMIPFLVIAPDVCLTCMYLAGYDAVAAGASLRKLKIKRSSNRSKSSSRSKRFERLEPFEDLNQERSVRWI